MHVCPSMCGGGGHEGTLSMGGAAVRQLQWKVFVHACERARMCVYVCMCGHVRVCVPARARETRGWEGVRNVIMRRGNVYKLKR